MSLTPPRNCEDAAAACGGSPPATYRYICLPVFLALAKKMFQGGGHEDGLIPIELDQFLQNVSVVVRAALCSLVQKLLRS